MKRNEIKEKLIDIMMGAMGDTDAIEKCTEDSLLSTDLGLNSVGILYTVMGIEDAFSVEFDDVGFSDFKTVGDVLDYIESKLA